MKNGLFIFYVTCLFPLWIYAGNGLLFPNVSGPNLRLVKNSVEDSVVKIVTADSGIKGTGYFIDANTVVTSLQILGNTDFQQPIYVENKLGKARVRGVTHLSALYNIAVLEVTDHPASPLSMGSTLEYESYILSYTSGELNKFIVTGTQLRNGLIHFFSKEHIDIHTVIGSPILNNKGQVVGIVSDNIDNIFIGAFMQHLRRLLREPPSPPSVSVREMMAEEMRRLDLLIEEGDVMAQFRLGRLFDKKRLRTGRGLAFYWYEKAAKQGHAFSQYILGDKYVGDGNYDEGFQWIEKAVDQGFFGAYSWYGFILSQGLGIKQDILKGIQWIEWALGLGDTRALALLQDIAGNGNIEAQKALSYIVYNVSNAKKCSRAFRLVVNN